MLTLCYKILLVVCLTLSAFITHANGEVTDIPSDIAAIFPTATRIAPPETDIPVIPVYQLNQLLGYAFESSSFTDFMGFSGEPINVLIGLAPNGIITGLKVIKHHEPIFVHGLGPEPMNEFVAQYIGHSIKERFIIGASDRSGDATHFDGVTKATVSVLVINDTIITSALKVAREKLDGFVAPSTKMVDPSLTVQPDWNKMVASGLIHRWMVPYAHVDNLESEVMEAIDELRTDDAEFIELYSAFLTIEPVGRAILGDAEYTRLLDNLAPGEQAILLLSKGDFSFISNDFRPATVPKRLNLVQNDFPIAIRDLDFYEYYDAQFAVTLPEYRDLLVVKLKSQSGFGLSMPMKFELGLDYNPSFLEVKQHYFTEDVSLPASIFVENPDAQIKAPQPLWVTIWQSRSWIIAATVLYLVALTVFFVKQDVLVKNGRLVRMVRFSALLFTLFFIGFYAQGQLSVVNIYTLLLALYNGFKIEVFLLDPVIFILWTYVFVSLFLFGRGLFCGWLCPFGALQEFAGMLAKKLKIKQWKIKDNTHQHLQKIKYVILFVLVFTAFYSIELAEKLAEIEPFKTSITLYFVRSWPFVIFALLLLGLSMKVHKVYCRYLCPLGAGLAVLGRYPVFKWLRRRDECGSPCQLCKNKQCEINAINKDGSIDYAECIQCLECVVTIEDPNLCKIDKYKNKRVKVKQVA